MILLHGLTATRRYVLHGSLALARRGYRQISYDARGHGESAPAPDGSGYGYENLTADLRAVAGERAPDAAPVLVGHSMGCHTAVAHALEHAGEVAALVLAGPVVLGLPPTEERLVYWDALADGLEQGGVDGFMEAYEASLEADPAWTETALRITRRADGTPPPPGGCRAGAPRGAAVGPFRGARGAGDARRARAGRRQLRRGRSRPSLRDRGGLGGAAAEGAIGERRARHSRRSLGRGGGSPG